MLWGRKKEEEEGDSVILRCVLASFLGSCVPAQAESLETVGHNCLCMCEIDCVSCTHRFTPVGGTVTTLLSSY